MRNNLYRFLTILCLFTLGISTLFAVPAYRGWQTVSQPDGSTITIRQMGDEFFHYWENEAGQQVEEDAQGYWHVLETPVVESQLQKKMRASRHYTQVKKSGQPAKVGGINLAPRGLVILVNFTDVTYQSYNTKAAMSELMNSENYTYNSATGSVREFFRAQSNGLYVPDFDVVGPYDLAHNREYYGANSGGSDAYAADMIIEACKAADADGVDFTKYNNDGDSYVDFVYVIYAGVGEADANPKVPNSIWPHNWTIDGARYWGNCTYTASQCKVDGLTINNYACSGELIGNASNRCPIGTITHEFGHVLGLPDYYVTDEDATNEDKDYTPGAWHIMDYGSYNNNGRTPPNYTPHDKYFFGWSTPTLLAKDAKKNCSLNTNYGSAYQITGGTALKGATASDRVWYLENRQKSGWDAYLPGHGMVVWEVTYNSTDWDNNEPNNENVGYTVVTANSLTRPYTPCVYNTTASSTSGTPFPGTGNVTSYTPAIGCALTEITESGGNITFKYNGGVIKTTCTYEFVTDHCAAPADGSVALNAPLSITITPATGYSLADASCWTVEMGGVALTYGTDFTYTPSTNTFYIASLTDDVVIMAEAKQIRTVTWSVNGATTTSTFPDGAALVLPTDPADCSGSGGKKFVGWTASSSVSGSVPADLFTSAGTKTVTANTTYYAVYATASGSGSFDGSTAGTYKIYAQVGDTRYYAKGTGSKISSTTSADDATEYTFEAVNGGLAIKTGTTYITYSSSTNLGTSTNAYTWNFAAGTKGTWRVNSATSGRGLIFRAGSMNQFGGYSTSNVTASGTEYYDLEIGGGGTSYSDYSTTCTETPCDYKVTLTKGSETNGTFTLDKANGEHNNCTANFVVTVSNITPASGYYCTGVTATGGANVSVSGPDGSGNYTVTYTKNNSITSTITANFAAVPTHTVTWSANGSTTTENYAEGAAITFPTSATGCTGKVFKGWSSTTIYPATDTEPTYVTSATMGTSDITYYAVFATETSGGGGTPTTLLSEDFSSITSGNSTSTSGSSSSWSGNANIMEVSTAYQAGGAVRIGSGSGKGYIRTKTLTASEGATLNVAFDVKGWSSVEGSIKVSVTDCADQTITYTATMSNDFQSKSAEFTLVSDNPSVTIASTAKRAFIDNVVITSDGSGSTTYSDYTTTCTIPTTVTVTFNANGGEGTMADQTIPYNEATALNANTFTRTGYTFQGWATSASGTKTYNDKQNVTLTKNTDLYAVWQKNSHNVSYYITPADKATATINSSATTPQSIEYGETVTLDITPDAEYNISSVTATGGVTLSGTGTQRTFTMPDNDVAISITLAAKPKYTVTWSANGSITTEEYLEGASINFPATATGCDGKVFVGWSAVTVNETDTKPALVTSATMGTSAVTYFAVYADAEDGSGGGSSTWSEAAIGTLTSLDIFVIVGNNGSSNYALPNSGNPPAVSSVTIEEGKITSTVSDGLKWNISGNSTDGYTFYPNGNTTSWLYCNTTADSKNNENIRVGTGSRNVWLLSGGQLVTKDSYVARYLAIQAAIDFRSYVLASTSTTTFKFYKYSAGGSGTTYTNYTTSCGAGINAKNVGWITATKGQKVKRVIEVSAKNFDEATTLSATCANSNFKVSLAATAVPDGAEGLTTTLTVEYIPTDFGTKDENVDIVLTAGDKTRTIKVNGRSLPEEFLLITPKSSKWYALPANMTSGLKEYDGVEVNPNDATTPTAVLFSPSTIIYTLTSIVDSRYEESGNCVRLVGNDNLCLWSNLASSTGKTNIQNKTGASGDALKSNEWLLTTSDGVHYTIANPNHPQYPSRRLAYDAKFGMYEEETVFYIVSAGCSSQPDDVRVSAHRVDATFAWISNASSMKIEVFTDAGMTSLKTSATTTSAPYTITGLDEKTEYWFKLTPETDTDCAVTGSFKTTGPSIDITEWKEDGVVLYVDKGDLTPTIVIDGQEEHGSITGGGGTATELFFAKYFEGAGNMKLISIFNGTNDPISLANYSIYIRCRGKEDGWAPSSDVPLDLSSLGTIAAGQEIIFFTREATGDLASCSDDFLDDKVTNSSSEGSNPRWVDCSGEPFQKITFNGNDPIMLKKSGTIIDIIGSQGAAATTYNCLSGNTSEKGWAGTVRNMDYGKSVDDPSFAAFYAASSKKPFDTKTDAEKKEVLEGFGINLDDEEINITTARCIFFRDKRVTSGDSAVLMNEQRKTGDYYNDNTFVTFTNHNAAGEPGTDFNSEWYGRSVCMDNAMKAAAGVTSDAQATCNSYQDIANMDYNDYYIDYTSHIEPGQLLDNYTHDDETHLYTIPITDLYKYTCLNLRFQLRDGEEVVTEAAQQVPIIVSGTKYTNSALFSQLVVDQETHLPSYSYSLERCKTCNVVVLGDATLEKVADGTADDVPEVKDIKVYPGGKLIVPSTGNYKINSLALRRQEDELSLADIKGGLTIGKDNSVFLDIRIDPTNWHYFTLPYDCNVSDIRFANENETAIPVVGTDFLLCSYDGEHRAATQSTSWKDLTSTDVLRKGVGYIIALPGEGKVQKEFRFPMSNDVIDEEKDDAGKTTGIFNAWGGNNSELRPNHKGWNLIGNPYMTYYETNLTSPLKTGLLVHDPDEDPWKGHWVIDDDIETKNVYYIVIPQDNGWSEYKQVAIANYHMAPFTSYFVQLGGNPSDDQTITYELGRAGRTNIVRRAPAEDIVDNHEVWFGVDLINTDGESDETTLLMSDKFTNDYDMMRDLVKMRGTYYTYYTKPVLASRNNEGEMAFNALPDSTAAAGVPLSFFAAADGKYRFTVSAHYPLDEVKEAYIYDNDNADAKWHNLLQEDYVFNTKRGDNTSRFLLAVKVERKQPEITTSIDNLHKGLVLTTINRTLMLSGLTNDADIYVYDVSGKLLDARLHYSSESGIFRTTVNTAGLYFVRVKTPDGQQTLETVVY